MFNPIYKNYKFCPSTVAPNSTPQNNIMHNVFQACLNPLVSLKDITEMLNTSKNVSQGLFSLIEVANDKILLTPLWLNLFNGRIDIALLLLQKGHEFNRLPRTPPNDDPNFIKNLRSTKGSLIWFVDQLLTHNNPNVKDENGVTLLQHFCQSNLFNLGSLKYLVRMGCDLYQLDKKGESIFDYICQNPSKISQCLQDKDLNVLKPKMPTFFLSLKRFEKEKLHLKVPKPLKFEIIKLIIQGEIETQISEDNNNALKHN